VEDGKVVVRPVMKIMATIDHRVMDGYKGGQLSAELRESVENPEKAFGLAEKISIAQKVQAESAC
jgi:pyruvate/2-oxoglutarate dehydrogenase complex dihydrolipoamide acyltransferase (E2) component